MLFVCYLCLGNKVNLLFEVIYGISFTGSVEPFFFLFYMLYGGGTECCIVPFCFYCRYKGGISFGIFTGDVTVSCC